MANKIYRISIQSVFFTTTLTAEEGSTFRAMKYNPGVIVECTEPNGRKTYSFHDQFVRTPQVDSLEELMNELETHLLVPGETFEVEYTDHWGDEVTVPIEVLSGEVFKINGKLLRGVLTLRREIDTITCGMYPIGYLRYKSNFEPNYPRSIVCYLDFADPGANIEIPLQGQLW
jgi:hypothetical protein